MKLGQVVRLRDVAHAAGVSLTTASMALRGTGTIAADTRRLVREAAERLHYSPNLMASSLRSGGHRAHTTTIPVCLLRDQTSNGLYPVTLVAEGMRHEAPRLGIDLEFIEMRSGTPAKRLLRELHHRGVRGLIAGRWLELNYDPTLSWERFCVLQAGLIRNETIFHSASGEIQHSTLKLLEYLWGLGYRRIGFSPFRHDEWTYDDMLRESAFLYFRSQLPPGCEQPSPFLGKHTDLPGFLDWVRRIEPDVVVGFHPGLAYHLESAGWRLPDDMGYVSLNAGPSPTDDWVASLVMGEFEFGRLVLRMMDAMLRHNHYGIPEVPTRTSVPHVLRPGRTLRTGAKPS